jgi:hypothetical protein
MSCNGYDALLTVIDKFTKWITLVPGKTTWGARDWAINYYDYVSKHGLPGVLISDWIPSSLFNFGRLFSNAPVCVLP